jgi:hypothetical protein
MSRWDLENFVTDCSIKEQQMAFLQSQRLSDNDRRAAGYRQLVTPWTVLTDPGRAHELKSRANGSTNWLVNQHILSLARNCP